MQASITYIHAIYDTNDCWPNISQAERFSINSNENHAFLRRPSWDKAPLSDAASSSSNENHAFSLGDDTFSERTWTTNADNLEDSIGEFPFTLLEEVIRAEEAEMNNFLENRPWDDIDDVDGRHIVHVIQR